MADADDQRNMPPGSIQDFIFLRELSEVYLLLDHVSGRWDKNFVALNGEGFLRKGDIPQTMAAPAAADVAVINSGLALDRLMIDDWIEEICKISWPPENAQPERARQAALLLRAKDRLSAAAKPASGTTIAFTLLVTGDDSASGGAPPSGNGPPSASGASFGGGAPPSRMSLARTAFPGLITVAYWFEWKIKAIVLFLCSTLIITCLLSWDMTSGYALLSRLETLHKQAYEFEQKIAEFDVQAQPALARLAGAAAKPGAAPAGLAPPPGLDCDQALALVGQAASLCSERLRIQRDEMVASEGLSDWLYFWRWSNRAYVIRYPDWRQGGSKAGHGVAGNAAIPAGGRIDQKFADEAWARNFVPLLLNCVLPFCYGILGAGAAVVRYLRLKTKESLLSPRDFTLATSQLVLGAVVGGCIGLFVGQPGSIDAGAKGLIAPNGLSLSALAFIAGFGVEGVFLALESLVRRIFNMPDLSPKT